MASQSTEAAPSRQWFRFSPSKSPRVSSSPPYEEQKPAIQKAPKDKGFMSQLKNVIPDSQEGINKDVTTLGGSNKGAIMRVFDPVKKIRKGKDKNMMSAYINSNVQGVNNSIVCSSSLSDHDPGIHVFISTNQTHF